MLIFLVMIPIGGQQEFYLKHLEYKNQIYKKLILTCLSLNLIKTKYNKSSKRCIY
jgi:hypothetical protein